MYSVYLCVLRPAFASWMRKNPQKPRGRLLMFLKHVTTCNGMHADWLPSADPWWFQVWLRWKRNRKVSKSRANSRQFGCLSSASRARCQQYTCRVRAHQRGGHMVQINHLIFFFFWVVQGQACHRGSGSERLLSCCGTSWHLTSCHSAAPFVKAQQKTSLPPSAFSFGLRFWASTFYQQCGFDRFRGEELYSARTVELVQLVIVILRRKCFLWCYNLNSSAPYVSVRGYFLPCLIFCKIWCMITVDSAVNIFSTWADDLSFASLLWFLAVCRF